MEWILKTMIVLINNFISNLNNNIYQIILMILLICYKCDNVRLNFYNWRVFDRFINYYLLIKYWWKQLVVQS